jgi:hypothetical protein
MSLTLNAYRRYIDLQSTEGWKLYNNTLTGLKSLLAKSAKINLVPEDFQKITDQMNCVGLQYGYDQMFKRVLLTQTITPAVSAIAAIVADPTATPPILAVPAVPAIPEQFIFGSFQNLLETYSADNIKMALVNASVVWGDDSFTLQNPQVLHEMTIANGLAKTPTNLKPNGEKGQNLQLLQMHSKFMAHHILEILSSPARQAIEQFKLVYTWMMI